MSAASPSEFLTFMRRVAIRSSIRPATRKPAFQTSRAVLQSRSLHTTPVRQASINTQEQHATEKAKKDQNDVQSDAIGKSSSAKAEGGGGNATAQKDSNNATEKAKKEHPEAPDTIIGMQDERGGKGG